MSTEIEHIEISYEDFLEDPLAVIEMATDECHIRTAWPDGTVIDYTGNGIQVVSDPGYDSYMRRFILNRKQDVTGVSGTGIVAEGVKFSDGTVALRWRGEFATTVFHSSIASVEHIHLHHGATSIEWVDMA